ncbi:alpha/beta fold hydrolase, partial [Lishizhenia sp.]|uniref:alpha/beta fold hydrolase n=1 Tax=Lishizhenia sp. TaxID=2497594 RepID=UPI00299CF79A
FPQQLCDRLKLSGIVYERQGYASSSPLTEKRNDDYLERYALDELPKFLDAVLEEKQKAILIGHSDGGSIALLYAQKYNERLKAVVTMAAHVINEPETLAGIQPAVEAYEKGKLDGLKKYHGDKTNDLFYAWANTWNAPFFKDWNICKKIDKVVVDALIIQGKMDQYGTEQQVDLILDHIQSSKKEKLMLDDCGHHPHLEQKQEVITAIYNFIID